MVMMNYKETLKEAFDKLYKQSVQQFEKVSKDLFFNKTKLALAKKKICVPLIEENSSISSKTSTRDTKTYKDKSENKTWKTTIFRRKKTAASTRKMVKTLRDKKENLRDSIDRLHLYHLVGVKKRPSTKKNTKITRRNLYLRTRKLKYIEKRKQPSQNEETGGRREKLRTMSDSKMHVTLHPKQKAHCYLLQQRQSESSPQEYSDAKSVNDSGVSFEEDKFQTDYKATTNQVNRLFRNRRVVLKENENPHFEKSFLQTIEDPIMSNRCSSRKRMTTEFENAMCKEEEPKSFHTSTPKSATNQKKTHFEPLFSNHCGGIWNTIVDEI